MFTTKFEGNDLTINIEETAQKALLAKGINPVEVSRLIESFAGKMLSSKKDEQLQISNADTGASFGLDVKWESDTKATVEVSIINLDNLTLDGKPKAKVNLAELAAKE
ncbi:hypothetical protein FO488_01780 [Geobacter sp. FeAm09]|uniref:hypothetical protein n=1 Tax=Geobacter sp. FeAm09 TaxID=2597769 RepID=UPI0011EFB4AF|nr:hypothetical protein [Geobacter sp. FeAm09]QEM67010.1 hypothetical protein FO488_01780 [Geobacter sp. FeAm09]